jgi:DNA transposition AAA+ family ATPase
MITHGDTIAAPKTNAKQGRIVATPTTESLAQLFNLCQMEAEMGVVTGEPGVGKTSAACRYVAGAEDAYLATMSPATSALVPCLARIGASVGAFVNSGGAGGCDSTLWGVL